MQGETERGQHFPQQVATFLALIEHQQFPWLRQRQQLRPRQTRRVGTAGLGHGHRDRERKFRSLPQHRMYRQFTAHQLDITLADGQPQTGTALVRRTDLFEGRKNARLVFAADTDAGIAHSEVQANILFILWLCRDAQGDAAFAGELDGIRQQIEQDLAQHARIEQDQPRQFGIVEVQAHPPFFGTQAHHLDHLRQQFRQINFFRTHLHRARFDLGKFQHIVDQSQQMFAGMADDAHVFLAHRRQPRIACHQAGKADYRIERGAQLMAHVGKKNRFAAVGRLGCIARFGQFLRPLADQFFQMFAIGRQFTFVFLALGNVGKNRDVAANAAFWTAQGADRQIFRKDLAILAPVPDFAAPVALVLQLLPQGCVKRFFMHARFQQTGITANHLTARITGNLAEGVVHPQNVALVIGNDGALGHGCKRCLVFPPLLFLPLEFGRTPGKYPVQHHDHQQSQQPDSPVPDPNGSPGRFLRGTIGIEVDRDRGATAQSSHRHQRVAVTFEAFLFHLHRNHCPHQAMPPFFG